MDAAGKNPLGAMLFEEMNRAGDRAGGVDLVINDNCALALYVADELQRLGHAVVARAPLLNDGQWRTHQLGEIARLLGKTDVRRHNDRIEQIKLSEVV